MIFYSKNWYRLIAFRASVLGVVLFLLLVFVLAFGSLQQTSGANVSHAETIDAKQIAVTFDDGPDPVYTRQIQEVLLAADVPATFFFTGEVMLQHPDVVRETFANGFLIGNHSYTHSRRAHRSQNRLAWELRMTNRVLEQQIGHETVLYRAPFLMDYENLPGEIIDGAKVHEAHPVRWAHEEGFVNVSAFIDGIDYEARSAGEILYNVESDLIGGNILLLHDGGGDRSPTVEALPLIIDSLRQQGYEFVGLETMLGTTKEALMPATPETSFLESASVSIAGSLFTHTKNGLSWLIWLILVLSFARIFMLVFYRVLPHHVTNQTWRGGVSVVIPAHNEAANIEATIRSVLTSKHSPLEVIVVDDGSTDDTVTIVRRLQHDLPARLSLITKPSGGQGKAAPLNVGIHAAVHPVVVAVDADTVLDPQAIPNLARHFNDPTVGVVAGTVRAIHGRRLIEIFQAIEYLVGQFIEKQAFNRIMGSVGVVPGAVGAWRRADVLAAGGYSLDTTVEDQDLTLAIHALGKKVYYEPNAIAYTEVPKTLGAFMRQRERWVFGSIQCLWKYRYRFFSCKRPQLGVVILPFNLVFSTTVALLSPIVDIVLLYHLFTGITSAILSVVIVFLVIDLLYVGVSLIATRAPAWFLLVVPIQRVFYRFALAYVLLGGLVKAIEGRRVSWGIHMRFGSAKEFFQYLTTSGAFHPK